MRRSISEIISSSGVKFGTSGARGLVQALTDEVCYAYTSAFLRAVVPDCRLLVLGHDLRPSSPAITAACLAAAEDAGVAVLYAGALPTPAIAYYAAQVEAPALVITGSHIPFDRNGIKFYRADGEISKADELSILGAGVDIPDSINSKPLPAVDDRPRVAYIERYLRFFGAGALVGATVAIYEHSSVARDLLGDILKRLGCRVLSLGRTEGFVPIDTEAVRAEDVIQARQWASTYRFDAIFSTDGDADRPLLGDENGNWFRGDMVGMLCAGYLNADAVVLPVSCNTAVEKSGWFRRVIRTRIGSPYVIAGMASVTDAGVVVGYEANGGFLLGTAICRDGVSLRALPTRDALLPMIALLCMAREKGVALSALTAGLPARFTASDRLQNVPGEKSRQLLDDLAGSNDAILSLVPDCGQLLASDSTDGLRMTFASGDIVHMRPSGNAPELRCYTEADTEVRAEELCRDCLLRIAGSIGH